MTPIDAKTVPHKLRNTSLPLNTGLYIISYYIAMLCEYSTNQILHSKSFEYFKTTIVGVADLGLLRDKALNDTDLGSVNYDITAQEISSLSELDNEMRVSSLFRLRCCKRGEIACLVFLEEYIG
jgi:hypothetical protein